MKLLAAALSSFLLFQPMLNALQQEQQNQKASIEGAVVRIGTGEPVAARVSLARVVIGPTGQPTVAPPVGPTPNIPPGASVGAVVSSPPAAIPSVMTDSKGKFVFKDLDPGAYRITIAANGYARQEYGQRLLVGGQGTPIILAPGQNLKDIVVRLTPAGNVSGRISDENGRPAAGVQVQLVRTSFNSSGQRQFQSAGQTRTNDRGEYRLFWVTPGRYFLLAGSQPGPVRPSEQGGVGDSPNGIQESYALTYYPGVMNVKDAMVLEVPSGVELNAIDFTAPRQQLFRIRGRIIDSRPPFVAISLSGQMLTGGGYMSAVTEAYNAATGEFEIRNVAPGSYSVTAQVTEANQLGLPDPRTPRPSAHAYVTVMNSDVENLLLTIVTGVSISGRLTVEGQELSALPGLDRLRVQLLAPYNADNLAPRPGLGGPTPQPQPINADGTFQIDNVVPGEYRVTVATLPPNLYVKEVRYDQTDALNNNLMFSGSVSGPINVVLSSRTAQIDGSAVDNGKPVAGVQAVLIPDQHRQRIELFKTALTDQNGHFTMRGVPPGDYKIFTWEAIEQFAYFDPDVLHRYETQGKPVRLVESDKQTVEVKIIPAEAR